MTIKNILNRPLSDFDRKLIRVAYLNPKLRYAALKLIADDSANKLKQFAGERKWKNPETSNLIGFDRVMELAGEDKMWAKAIVKKVQEEYKREGGGSDTKSIENRVFKKLKSEIENEIKQFKNNKDITNPKDRADFEAYLDSKIRPVQNDFYKKKILEETGIAEQEYNRAVKALEDSTKNKDEKKAWDETIKSAFGGWAAGAGVVSAVAGIALGAPLVGGALGVAGVISFLAKKQQAYSKTDTAKEKSEFLKELTSKTEEIKKKWERKERYENIGKDQATLTGMRDFFKDDKFDDDILGDDLTIKELIDISEDKTNYDNAERANKILQEKKTEYMTAKFQREKFLTQEAKGKKFKSPEGKRVTVKEMLQMEEEGDNWASKKLKELRHTLEGPEEVGDEETEKQKEDRILRERENHSLNDFRDSTHEDLEETLAQRDPAEVDDLLKDLESDLDNLSAPQPEPEEEEEEKPKRKYTKKKKNRSNSSSRSKSKDSGITEEDAKVVLRAIRDIRLEQENLGEKYKNETFENPDGKTIKFNTLKTYFGNKNHKHHEWAKKEWAKLKKGMNKKGSSQDEEINKIVKEKMDGAFDVHPDIVQIFKGFTTNGKFDESKFKEMLKELQEFGKEIEKAKSNKKASLDRVALIKLAYHNPDKRAEILKLLIK